MIAMQRWILAKKTAMGSVIFVEKLQYSTNAPNAVVWPAVYLVARSTKQLYALIIRFIILISTWTLFSDEL
jgi:hypothetical protein